MKPSRSLLLAGALALAPAAALAAALTASSTITAVTVYADRAIVTRTATLEPAAGGALEVQFDRLPASLLEPSLTVAGRGTAPATILDVTSRIVHVDMSPNERVQAIEDELRDLARRRRGLEDRAAVLKEQEASLGRLEAAATAPPVRDSAPRLTIEESLKLLAFLEEQRSRQLAERQTLDTQLAAITASQGTAQKQLAELRGGAARSYRTVTVRLAVESPGRLQLDLGYAVPGASWTPSYDARASSHEPAIELGYFGRVRQNTGEDWKDVALTLSTAQPSLGGSPPEPGSWVLDVARPWTVGGSVSTASTAPAATALGPTVKLDAFTVMAPGQRARPTPPEPPAVLAAREAEAAVETAATSASFKIAVAASVPSDNSPQKIPVTTVKLAAVPEYATTPKRLAAAFLTAQVTNTSEFPLLPGAINVFLDGSFVATSALRGVMPGEKFELALGADEGIAVKHKRVQRFVEDTGLTSRGRRITYEYLVTIQNNKREPARVVVADRVPQSRYERIVVRVLTPPEKEQKPASDGALKWTLDLKPGEKRELPLKFSIEYPADLAVAGLES